MHFEVSHMRFFSDVSFSMGFCHLFQQGIRLSFWMQAFSTGFWNIPKVKKKCRRFMKIRFWTHVIKMFSMVIYAVRQSYMNQSSLDTVILFLSDYQEWQSMANLTLNNEAQNSLLPDWFGVGSLILPDCIACNEKPCLEFNSSCWLVLFCFQLGSLLYFPPENII